MRRFTGFFAIIAILLSLASAQAQQQTYSQPVTFQTSNQSMWGAGTAGYNYTLDLTKSWDTRYDGSAYTSIWPLGRFGSAYTLIAKGRAGLLFNAYATSGNVDVNYPGTL